MFSGKMKLIILHLLVVFFLFQDIYGSNATSDGRKHYIVYMGSHSFPDSESLISSNNDLLSSVIGSSEAAKEATIYHYHRSFRGFSAMLTPEQAHQISQYESVVSVLENTFGHLNTMRSWDFLGASTKSVFFEASNKTNYDVIVGHFDTGLWPESPSFRPDGLGPVPRRWKGSCNGPEHCTRKVIGYRWYSSGFEQEYGPLESYGQDYYLSARDDYGHGTHTASIAVGSVIKNVDLKGMGSSQDIRGGAPGARLAVYKICWFGKCSCADMLKAFDDAIADGVDIITMSVGFHARNNQPNFIHDCASNGSFHAFQNGILVSSCAGNDKDVGTLQNAAPWMLTVGASTIDREFVAPLELGNSVILRGKGLNLNDTKGYHGVVYARSAALQGVSEDRASTCDEINTLDTEVIRGKIVVCTMKNWDDENQVKLWVVSRGGGVGAIIINPGRSEHTWIDNPIPAIFIGPKNAKKLDAYMNSSKNATAFIHSDGAKLNFRHAPRIADFSSRGPGSAPDIIKPDIAAPGVNIIASWPAWGQEDKSTPWFQFDSGTSMACPHATGVAALVKGAHRDWSPAAIKSALMTTASHLESTGKAIKSRQGKATPFNMGSGNLNPTKALNPGLVYDYDMNDVISYLCNIVNPQQLKSVFNISVTCPSPAVPTYNLNYPSISVSNLKSEVVVTRTVTYVGHKGDPKKFHIKIENPKGVSLHVEPSVLDFSDGRKHATFTVHVRAWQRRHGRYVFGSITWFNEVHSVRSPVAIRTA